MKHLSDCDVGRRQGEVCKTPYHLSDGVHHWWSGWPGAFCLGCEADDPMENCIGGCCKCPCHDAVWEANAAYKKTKKQNGGNRKKK